MLRPFLTFSVIPLVCICATSAPQAAARKERAAEDVITVNCSGPTGGWVFCYRSASQACGPTGYTVVRREGAIGATASQEDARVLVVKCN
ncbi:MAG: hypothetical protein ABL964_04615 [Steroidobacteraceae bacterium]